MLLHRGSRGRELILLTDGEAHMLDPYAINLVTAKIRPKEIDIMSAVSPGQVAYTKPAMGVLGGAVLNGTRHSHNVIAADGTDCVAYILERADLKELFIRYPKAATFFRVNVVQEMRKKSHLEWLCRVFLMALLPKTTKLYAVLVIQRAWQTLMFYDKHSSQEALLEEEGDLRRKKVAARTRDAPSPSVAHSELVSRTLLDEMEFRLNSTLDKFRTKLIADLQDASFTKLPEAEAVKVVR